MRSGCFEHQDGLAHSSASEGSLGTVDTGRGRYESAEGQRSAWQGRRRAGGKEGPRPDARIILREVVHGVMDWPWSGTCLGVGGRKGEVTSWCVLSLLDSRPGLRGCERPRQAARAYLHPLYAADLVLGVDQHFRDVHTVARDDLVAGRASPCRSLLLRRFDDMRLSWP